MRPLCPSWTTSSRSGQTLQVRAPRRRRRPAGRGWVRGADAAGRAVAVAVASLQLMRPSLLALSSLPALLAALLQGPVAVPPAEALAGAHALRAGAAMRGALEAARAGAALEALVAGALSEALRLLDAPAPADALESALAGWVGAGGAAPCGVGGVSVRGGAAEVAAVFSRASPACLARACSPAAAPRSGWGYAAPGPPPPPPLVLALSGHAASLTLY